jgi:hypothetical protein
VRLVHIITGVAVATLLQPGVAWAAPEDDSGEAGWQMPDITEMNLQAADDELKQAADGADLELHTENINGVHQDQLVYKFWKVCWQSPEAGEMVTPETWVGVGVTRSNIECWPG